MKVLHVAIAVAAVWLIVHAMPGTVESFKGFPFDGKIDWLEARAWSDGINPYSPEGFEKIGHPALGMGHPPTTGFWFLPLRQLELQAMAQVLNQLVLVVLLLHLVIVAIELRAPAPLATAAALFGLVLSTSWMRYHFSVAQISELIAFLYVLAWVGLRRGHQVLGGALLGLACTFKLLPGVMVVMLLLSRRWRGFLAACGAWLAVAMVMTWRFGWVSWRQFLTMQKPIADFWLSDLSNGSLQGILLRLFRPELPNHGPPIPVVTAAAVVLSLALLAEAFRVSRRALAAPVQSAPGLSPIDLPFALFSVLSYFVSPWCWEHYYVFLLLPGAIAAAALVEERRPVRWVIGGLTLVAVMGVLSIDRVAKFQAQRAWATHTGSHWQFHAYEIANWLPTVLMLGLLYALTRARAKNTVAAKGAT